MRKVEMTELRVVEAGAGELTTFFSTVGSLVSDFYFGTAETFAASGKKFLLNFGTFFDGAFTVGINLLAFFGIKANSFGVFTKEINLKTLAK